jgi:hypothetical protein
MTCPSRNAATLAAVVVITLLAPPPLRADPIMVTGGDVQVEVNITDARLTLVGDGFLVRTGSEDFFTNVGPASPFPTGTTVDLGAGGNRRISGAGKPPSTVCITISSTSGLARAAARSRRLRSPLPVRVGCRQLNCHLPSAGSLPPFRPPTLARRMWFSRQRSSAAARREPRSWGFRRKADSRRSTARSRCRARTTSFSTSSLPQACQPRSRER